MPVITSRQHAIVKECRAIARGDERRLLLDGWHLVTDAVAAGVRIEWLAVRSDCNAADLSRLTRLATGDLAIHEVSSSVMAALSPVRASSGVVAVAARPAIEVGALVRPAPALTVVGLGLQDPGNVGALVRSADAGGATGVLVDGRSADPWGWKALRASMGSAFRLPVCRLADAVPVLADWKARDVRLVASDPREGVPMYDFDFTAPVALLLGSEGAGLPAEVLALSSARVRIPMRAGVESLNVAVAAALLVYEAARQRA